MHNIMGFEIITENYPNVPLSEVSTYYGNLQSCLNIGTIVGSVIGGILATHVGKVKTVIIAEIFFTCSLISLFFMKYSIWLNAVANVFQGLMTSLNQVSNIRTIKEILPRSVLNFGGVIPVAFQVVGSLAATIIGNVYDRKLLAKNAFLVFPCLIVFVIIRLVLLTFYFNVESPIFVIEKFAEKLDDLNEDSATALRYDNPEFAHGIRGEKFILNEKNTKRVRGILGKIYSKNGMVKAEDDLIKEMDEHFRKTRTCFIEIFKSYWRRALIICLILHT